MADWRDDVEPHNLASAEELEEVIYKAANRAAFARCPQLLRLAGTEPSTTSHTDPRIKSLVDAIEDITGAARKTVLSSRSELIPKKPIHCQLVAAAGELLGFTNPDEFQEASKLAIRAQPERDKLNSLILHLKGNRKRRAAIWTFTADVRTAERNRGQWYNALIEQLRRRLSDDSAECIESKTAPTTAAGSVVKEEGVVADHQYTPELHITVEGHDDDHAPTAAFPRPDIYDLRGWFRNVNRILGPDADPEVADRLWLRFSVRSFEVALYVLAYMVLVALFWLFTAISPPPPDDPLRTIARIIRPGIFPLLALTAGLTPFVLLPAVRFGRKYRVWSIVSLAAVCLCYSLALLYSGVSAM